jgi:hypothetical protein
MKLSKIKTFTKKYAYVIIISLIFIGIFVVLSVHFARRSKNSENWNTAADAQRRYAYETQIKNEIRKDVGNIANCGTLPDGQGWVYVNSSRDNIFSKWVCEYKRTDAEVKRLMDIWDNKNKVPSQSDNKKAIDKNKSEYSNTKNPNTETKLGCPYTLGLTTSDSNEEAVKRTCDLDPNCVGYYVGSTGWSIATQILPSECTDNTGTEGYSVFKSKSSKYASAVNPKNKFGCPYTPGLTTSDSNEEAVKRTCDLDPKCVGYYKGSTGWCVASQTLPKSCKNFSGDAGYKDFMMKVSNKGSSQSDNKKEDKVVPKSDNKKTNDSNKSSISGYSNTKNPNTETKLGCPYTLGLTTSDSNEEAVKRTCDLDPKCVGYYLGSTGWTIATKTLPHECKDFTMTPNGGYNVFKSKSSKYASKKNPNTETKAGCIYTPGLTTSDSNEEAVKRTCDLDPKCVGYYKGSTGWCVASQTLPSKCKNFSGDAGYKDFMMKVQNK